MLTIRSYELGVLFLPSAYTTVSDDGVLHPVVFRPAFQYVSDEVEGRACSKKVRSRPVDGAGGAGSSAAGGDMLDHDHDLALALSLSLEHSTALASASTPVVATATGAGPVSTGVIELSDSDDDCRRGPDEAYDGATEPESPTTAARVLLLPSMPSTRNAGAPGPGHSGAASHRRHVGGGRSGGGGGGGGPAGGVGDVDGATPSRSTSGYRVIPGDLLTCKASYIAQQCNCVSRGARGLAKALFHAFPHADVYKRRRAHSTAG